jgi:hypothetical protein
VNLDSNTCFSRNRVHIHIRHHLAKEALIKAIVLNCDFGLPHIEAQNGRNTGGISTFCNEEMRQTGGASECKGFNQRFPKQNVDSEKGL